MREKLLHPATFIATIALFVALSGTGYAVTQLPKNSVGTAQLKKDAVTADKVKDGALGASDLSAAAKAALKGDTGATGARGAIGPSNVYAAYRDLISPPALTANTTATVMTLSVPAGKYAITSKLGLDDAAAGGPRTAICTLYAENDNDTTYISLGGVGGYPCVNLVVHEFSSAGTVLLKVFAPVGSTTRAGYGKITAVKVDSLSNVPVTG